MTQILDYPTAIAVLSFALLWIGTRLAILVLRRRGLHSPEDKADFGIVQSAVLTLMGLIIGFTFSMAISRYDQRKNLEEAEANAIGTEYVRAELLPATDAATVRRLLKDYTAQRILFYGSHSQAELRQIAARRSQLQQELWDAVLPMARAQATPVTTLVLSGMNDVLNSQGYTHAAWLNRIPVQAWVLLLSLALLSNTMITYSASSLQKTRWRVTILPLVVAVSFWLIADIDSPRNGLVTVSAPNLSILLADMR
jgi:hypothetical protein